MSYIFFLFLLSLFALALLNARLLSFVEMEVARQRALVRASTTSKKKKEKDGASSSTPKYVTKVTSKRKNKGKDDRQLKRGPVVLVDRKPKKSSPLKPSYGVGKGLMTLTSPVTQGSVCRFLTHKDHAIEVMKSIIKDTNMDPCAEQTTKELGALGLFDLSRVRLFHSFLFSFFFFSI